MWQVHERINQIRENYEGTIKFEEGIVKIENYKGTIRYERLLEETIEELAAFPTY